MLLLVRGIQEGRAFALSGEGPWTIGRRYGLPVSLDYDPYISSEHAVVRMERGVATLETLPDARNGTTVNWRQLDAPHALRHGDVVGLGRSILLYTTPMRG